MHNESVRRTGNDVLLRPQQVADRYLLDVGVLFLEFLAQGESNHG